MREEFFWILGFPKNSIVAIEKYEISLLSTMLQNYFEPY